MLASLVGFVVLASLVASAPVRAQTEYILGVDVSHHQNAIDWSKVVDSGHVFAFHKATEGATFIDNRYASNREAVAAESIPFGAYHFARPNGGGIAAAQADAASEAQHFLEVANPLPGDLVPVLDLEDNGGLPPNRLIAWTQAWLDHVESVLEVKSLIYTSPNFWTTNMNDTTKFAVEGFPLWIAHYTSDPAPRTPATNWSGRGWAFWQFTSEGDVPGISGNADRDRFIGSDFTPYTIPGSPSPVPTPDPAVPPTNHSPPQITGDTEVGKTLSASTGTWSGSTPLSYTYEWFRCDDVGAVCEGVLNGTESTYKLVPSDFAHRMKVRVTATNSAGSAPSDSALTEPITDTTPPSVPAMTNPKRAVTLAPEINVGWTATGQEPTTFEVRYRSAGRGSGFGDHVDLTGPTNSNSATLEATPGTTYCFSARAFDQAGNASQWSRELCTAQPLDDRDLSGGGQWEQRDGNAFYRETLSLTGRKGRSLIARDVLVRDIRVVVQRCPGCGAIAVLFNGRRVDTISLRAGRTRNQQIIRSDSFGRVRRGDVSIVVLSGAVKIDGLALVRI